VNCLVRAAATRPDRVSEKMATTRQTATTGTDWYVSGGCIQHVTGTRSYFTEYVAYKPGEKVVGMFYSSPVEALGIGNVTLRFRLAGGRIKEVMVGDVFHFAGASNILSQSRPMKGGIRMECINGFGMA
jgi:hypothetical protein